MHNDRRPLRLYSAAVEAENQRHAARLKALRAMEKKLDMLEPHLPKLAEHGIKFEGGALHDLDASWGYHGLKLPYSISKEGQQRLYDALRACGFAELPNEFASGDIHQRVRMKHGRLEVYFWMDRRPAAAAAQTTPVAA